MRQFPYNQRKLRYHPTAHYPYTGNDAANHVFLRDGVYYYLRRVPLDLAEH